MGRDWCKGAGERRDMTRASVLYLDSCWKVVHLCSLLAGVLGLASGVQVRSNELLLWEKLLEWQRSYARADEDDVDKTELYRNVKQSI